MKKVLKVLLLLVLVAATVVSTAGCAQTFKQVSGADEKKEKALKAQPEISDPGNAVEYTVSKTFSSDMVLQRDKVIRVWGWSQNKGSYIYGELLGEKRYAQIDENGQWLLEFSPKKYSTEGTTLKIYPKNGTETIFENVLIGDVWIVSGQSNAEYSFKEMAVMYTECYDYIDSNDNIRLYRENKADAHVNGAQICYGEQLDVINPEYKWEKTTVESVEPFSAAGYSFVKELSRNTDIPQGIIMAAAGGCYINEFMTPKTGANTSVFAKVWAEEQAIYKYFLAPFKHMALRGILFYQGESDNQWPKLYDDMLADCVAGWREDFDSTFAFYNIQCTSHSALVQAFPGLPGLRAAQLDAYYKIPNSYLISTLDVGYRLRGEGEPEEDYAHTFNKKTIGERAAHIALSELYNVKGFEYKYVAAPLPSKVKWSKDSVSIDFTNVGDGLKAYEGDLIGFKIMLEDESIVNASAKVVDKNTVKVYIPSNLEMDYIAVCYAYEHSALLEEANLVNSNDIPSPTFKFYTKEYIKLDEQTMAR